MKEQEELQKQIELMQREIFKLKKKVSEMDNDLYGLVSDRDKLFRIYNNKLLRGTRVKLAGIKEEFLIKNE